MDMIDRQDRGIDGTARAFSRVLHRGEVEAIVLGTTENRLEIIAPLDDVLGHSKDIVTGGRGHGRFLCVRLALLPHGPY